MFKEFIEILKTEPKPNPKYKGKHYTDYHTNTFGTISIKRGHTNNSLKHNAGPAPDPAPGPAPKKTLSFTIPAPAPESKPTALKTVIAKNPPPPPQPVPQPQPVPSPPPAPAPAAKSKPPVPKAVNNTVTVSQPTAGKSSICNLISAGSMNGGSMKKKSKTIKKTKNTKTKSKTKKNKNNIKRLQNKKH